MIQIEFIGNVGADAELKQTTQGKEFVTFRVAVSKRWKDEHGNPQERTKWISCSRNGSKSFADCIKQGRKVYIRGDVDTRAYTSAGQPYAELVCYVAEIEFLNSLKTNDEPF